MKKFTSLIILLMVRVVGLFAQAPEKFTYQAVVRFANNSLAANTQIGVRISILQGSVVGNAVFVETHIVQSNANGLITLEIGNGNVQVGSISSIDWSDGMYFLRTETDPYGGIDYIVTSTQQLMSVPYALYAKEAGNGFSGDYNDLTNTPEIPTVPTNISAFVNDVPYLTTFTEQQVLSISNDTIFLTGGSFVKLPATSSGFSGDYNDLINTPTIPTVPTNVSAFINDAGYITNSDIPEIPTVPTNVSAFNNDAGYLTSFTEQQVLSISNDTIFLTGGSYVKLPAGFDGDYNSLSNKPEIPTIPTNVSAFSNDANYITETQLNAHNYVTAADIPAQVNADWNATSGAAEILNKPTIPSSVSELANDANYITINDIPEIPTVPENVSAFNNDMGYITEADIPEIPVVPTNVSAFTNDAGYLTSFTEQQVLTISNDTIFLTGGSFVKLPATSSGFSGDYNDLINKPTIPTVPSNVSAFSNDAGYITAAEVPAQVNADWNASDGAAEILNKPTIPTTVSELTNDANFITLNDIPEIPTIPENVSAFTNDAGYLTSFTEQQVLTISNDTIFLTGGSFVKLPAAAVGFSGDYNDLINTPTIPTVPTNVSAFTNDAGYITNADIPEIPVVPTNVSAFTNDASYVTTSQLNESNYITAADIPAQVNADWNATSGAAEILNKPTIPTLVSELTNDANYITINDVPEIPTVPTNVSAFTNDAGYLTSFTEQQVLTISNDTIFLTGGSFVKLPAATAGFSGDYNDLINTPTIPTVPTNVGAFTNDAGYITMDSVPAIPTNISDLTNDAGYLTSYTETDPLFNAWDKDYNDLINKPEIPTVPSDISVFNNDANYVTTSQLNAANYITTADIPAQVNADWNATSGAAEILNKPTIPTTVSELTNDANYITLGDIPEIPTVPTNVSAFTNDAGYITNADIPTVPTNVGVFTNDANYITNTGSCADSVNLCELFERLEMLENQLQPIMIMTEGVTEITQTSFTVNGKVLADSNNTITQRGFVYGIDHNPTLNNNRVNNGNGNGTFTSTITGLNAAHSYYVRAFAINNNGTFYGNEMVVTTTAPSPSTLPSVTTIAVTNITVNEATVRGAVTSDGGETVTQRGFVYDTLPNPTINNLVSYHGTGVGQYVNLLTYLYPGKTYYFRAFAQNSVGVAYGNELTFTTNVPSPVAGDAIPCPGTPTVTDHEGNVYNTVQIGTQCWTKENLRTTTSPSTGTYLIPPAGTAPTYTGKQAWWYDNDSATYATINCGLLYNYNAAIDTFNTDFGETSLSSVYEEGINYDFAEPRRGICPQGWHVPSHAEWMQLYDYLNSHEEYRSGNVSGNVVKSLVTTNYWETAEEVYSPGNLPSENNLSGFSAIPAGCRGIEHHLIYYGQNASFWSTTPWWDLRMWHFTLLFNNADVWQNGAYKDGGMSVRCLRD